MAKFTIEITENKIIETLDFMDKQFKNTWVPDDTGSHTIEKSFETQVEKAFPHIDAYALDKIEDLGFSDHDEIQEILEELSEYEE